MKKKFSFVAVCLAVVLCSQARPVSVDAISAASPTEKSQKSAALPRKKPSKAMKQALQEYLTAAQEKKINLHSVMILQHGKVIAEQWMGEGKPDVPHILNSVSKTFTSMAVGLCINEGKLKLDDKVISFFPDKVPANPSENLKKMTVRNLLTMNCGHDTDPTGKIRNREGADWVEDFLAYPVEHEPGTWFCYNSLGTYILSAIVQKVTGSTVLDYLAPRLFKPLGIEGATWQSSPQGINCGGWGLYLKTEDLAKMGQLILQQGKWKGKQVLPREWVEQASQKQVDCLPAGQTMEDAKKNGLNLNTSDWVQGYGYQMWRCRHNAFRADGANGQYIIVMPEVDAVVINTADLRDMQAELNLVWDYLLPALQK